MFCTQAGLEKALNKVLGKEKDSAALKLEITKLKEELENLKLQKKMEETEIKHLVKMKEEKQAIELEKAMNAQTKDFNKKEMDLQTKYHEKIMVVLEEGSKKLQDIYKEILGRLPNVNVEMKR